MWSQGLLKLLVLIGGLILLLFNYQSGGFSAQLQLKIFIAGLIVFGIPHGAADRLVASKNTVSQKKHNSNLRFNIIYLGSIALFSAFLFAFPFLGTTIFILLSAYHFGESDLQQISTHTLFGKIMLFNYGLCILSVIFLPKFPELLASIRPMVTNTEAVQLLHQVNTHHNIILIIILGSFAFNCCLYFLQHPESFIVSRQDFFLNVLLLPVLYFLPMLLSFSFYFLLWHSVFSMRTILLYLLKNNDLKRATVTREILSNSAIALIGIGVFCSVASFGATPYNLTIYAVFGLAVLTAAHMQVMHQMYQQIKIRKDKT
jgi:Brp/Blh family beta-carotene 15,15'-monooxygenase